MGNSFRLLIFSLLTFVFVSCSAAKYGKNSTTTKVTDNTTGGIITDPSSCTSDETGEEIESGGIETREKYKLEISSNCEASTNKETQSRVCTNGEFGSWKKPSGSINGLFTKDTCEAPAETSTIKINSVAFSPLSPSNDTSPTLSLSLSDSTALYSLYKTAGCSSGALFSNLTQDALESGVALTINLNAPTTFYVKSSKVANSCLTVGTYVHDSTPPNAPTLNNIALVHSSITSSPNLSWSSVTGATKYLLAIGSTAGSYDISGGTSPKETTALSFPSMTVQMTSGTKYYVSAWAVDAAGNVSTNYSQKSFTAYTSVNTPTLAIPADLIASGSTVPSVNSSSKSISGTCIAGSPVRFTYGTGVSGPATVNCETNNQYTAVFAFSGDAGPRTITVTQNNGVTDISIVINLNYNKSAQSTGNTVLMGHESGCTIKNYKAYCWGTNNYNQLAQGPTPSGTAAISRSDSPLAINFGAIPTTDKIVQISAGDQAAPWYTFCALSDKGKAYCWGYDSNEGNLGFVGTSVSINAPKAVTPTSNTYKQISVGFRNSCALGTDDKVYCWGYGQHGQILPSTAANFTSATAVNFNFPSKVLQVAVGGYTSCVVLEDGDIWCWGHGGYGQLGDGDTTSTVNRASKEPTKVPRSYLNRSKELNQNELFTSVSVGPYHTCGTTSLKNIYCWGYTYYGTQGSGEMTKYNYTPIYAAKTSDSFYPSFEKVSAGGYYGSQDYNTTCGITTQGKLYCWGSNYYGKVGSGTSETYAQYANALDKDAAGNDLPAFVDVDVGVNNICARTADEKTYCWGYNASGDIRVGIPGATSSIGKPKLISLPN